MWCRSAPRTRPRPSSSAALPAPASCCTGMTSCFSQSGTTERERSRTDAEPPHVASREPERPLPAHPPDRVVPGLEDVVSAPAAVRPALAEPDAAGSLAVHRDVREGLPGRRGGPSPVRPARPHLPRSEDGPEPRLLDRAGPLLDYGGRRRRKRHLAFRQQLRD